MNNNNNMKNKTITHKRQRKRTCSSLLLSSVAFTSLLLTPTSSSSITAIGRIIDPNNCYLALTTADSNNDLFLSPSEYKSFLAIISASSPSASLFSSAVNQQEDGLKGVPLEAVLIFNELANGNPGLDISGADGDPTSAEQVFLYELCSDTTEMIEGLVEAPSSAPTSTTSPSSSPTVPSTNAPTESSTDAPTTTPLVGCNAVDVCETNVCGGGKDWICCQESFPPSGKFACQLRSSSNCQRSCPTQPPSTSPSFTPTSSPTSPSSVSVTNSFLIGTERVFRNDDILSGENGIRADLEEAFDRMMPGVLDGFGRRRLEVTYDRSTVTAVEDSDCPNDAPPTTQFCHKVTSSTTLTTPSTTSPISLALAIESAISTGKLSSNLPQDTSISYTGSLSSLDSTAQSPNNEKNVNTIKEQETEQLGDAGMSISVIMGIAGGSLAAICVALGGLFLSRKNRMNKHEEPLPTFSSSRVDDCGRSTSSSARLGATSPNYGGNIHSKATIRHMHHLDEEEEEEDTSIVSEEEEEVIMRPPVGITRPPLAPSSRSVRSGSQASDPYYNIAGDTSVSVDSSSNAGSSGWSSSAGLSSLNTQSVDSSLDFGDRRKVSTLAAIGVASGVAGRTKSSPVQQQQQQQPVGERRGVNGNGGTQFIPVVHDNSTIESDTFSASSNPLLDNKTIERGSVPSLPQVTRNDLDSAIEAGDWAAVGATAALLASSSDISSYKSTNSHLTRSTLNSKGSNVSSIDAARAAELDHLVDAGDWEGVVLAAAKFEAGDNDTTGSKSVNSEVYSAKSTLTDPSRETTGTGSVGTSSAYSTGFSASVSESPSKAQKRAEIRTEVEALVRRVVPDEIDNVDEMMLQFNGREEELVETLRTMQERSIAQRARAAVHRTAKRNARMNRGENMPPLHTTGVPQTENSSGVVSSGSMSSNGGSGNRMGVAAGAAVGATAAYGASRAMEKDDEEERQQQSSGSRTPPQDPTEEEDAFEENSQHLTASDSHLDRSTHYTTSTPLTPLTPTTPTTNESYEDNPALPMSESTPTPSQNNTNSSNTNDTTSKSQKYSSGTSPSSRTMALSSASPSSRTAGSRTALELAIEAGDWEAVGEAAAMMSDASVTTMSTAEIRDMADSDYESSTSKKRSRHETNANRAAALDKLIDVGDWTGVVAAASRFSDLDKSSSTLGNSGNLTSESRTTENSLGEKSSARSSTSNGRGTMEAVQEVAEPTKKQWKPQSQNTLQLNQPIKEVTEEESSVSSGSVGGIETNQALKEEQDALAQAEIWLKIAEQSKQGGGAEAKGASDAADWAISRSLSALHSAEQKGELTSQKNPAAPMSSAASQVSVGSSKCDKSV